MESSWFTTKKRGRDDDKIEEDKVLARQARSRRKPAATNRKMKKQIPQCNSDGDSLDDFIVEDDVLSEDENVSSNKSSDDDDDLDSYLGLSGKRRVSRPPNPPKRKFGQKMPDKRARAPKLKGKKMKPMLKNHSSSTIDLCSSSDSEFDEPSKKTSKTFQRKVSESDSRGQQSHDSIFSDDDGDDETGILAYRKGGEPAAIPSVAAASNKEECEDEGSPFPSLKARRGKPKRFAIMDDKSEDGGFGGDCLVDSPSPLKKMSRKKSQFARKQQPASKTSGRNPALNDDLSDDDALALALALSKSEKEAGKMPGLDSASDGDNKVDVELLDTSDEEDGDEEDAYSDPAAKEASSVLDKANALSAQILSTLTKWSASVETSVAPELGMISNGAITLSTTVADRSHDHTWISKELMSEICPSVTLADYQLIGVNWIALLHGLKSETEGSKSYTNVNGILADGK